MAAFQIIENNWSLAKTSDETTIASKRRCIVIRVPFSRLVDAPCVECRDEEKEVGMKVLLQRNSARLPDDHNRLTRRTSYPPGTSTQNRLPTGMWVEVAMGLMSASFLALTILLPDWMEVLFTVAPDAGDGSAEWGLALSWALVSVLMFAIAGRTWKKHVRLLREA